jgi:hypothetical protein
LAPPKYCLFQPGVLPGFCQNAVRYSPPDNNRWHCASVKVQ